MPVQFVCPQCRGLMSIATRKIGSVIQCPRCQVATVVPDAQTAAAQLAALHGMQHGGVMELVVYDDVPELLGQPTPPASFSPAASGGGYFPPTPAAQATSTLPAPATTAPAALGATPLSPTTAGSSPWSAPVSPMTPPASAFPAASTSPPFATAQGSAPFGSLSAGASSTPMSAARGSTPAARSVSLPGQPSEYLLIARSVVYVQGLILFLLLVVAGGGGYLLGLGQGRSEAPSGGSSSSVLETINFRGAVVIDIGGGFVPDARAIVLAIPRSRPLSSKLRLTGLRLGQDDDARDSAIDEVRSVGGDGVVADGQGTFHLVVSRSDDYFVLIISGQSQRAAGEGLDPTHLAEMNVWLENPAATIGPRRYTWLKRRLEGNPAPLTQSFPPSAT